MALTKADAEDKWCFLSNTRYGDNRCIAANCMAWVWVSQLHADTRTGRCGLIKGTCDDK